jgi:hypothetical protein
MFGESRTRLAPGLDKGFLMDVGPQPVAEMENSTAVDLTDAGQHGIESGRVRQSLMRTGQGGTI